MNIEGLKNYVKEVEEDIEDLSSKGKYTKIIACSHIGQLSLLCDYGIIDIKEYDEITKRIEKKAKLSQDEFFEAAFLIVNE